MDHIRILNQIISKDNIVKAFHYAYYDRINNDYYYDYFEMEFVYKNKDKIINEILEEIKDLNSYAQRTAYAYYPPKNELCFRRMIYIPFKDLVLRYAFTIVLAEYIDPELSNNCFANRKAEKNPSKFSFLQNFATESWPNFCDWQKKSIETYSLLLRTDISSFYDSISHEYLCATVADSLTIPNDSQVMKLFKKILSVPVISYSNLTNQVLSSEELKQGLPIGNNTEGFLANVYLKNVDDKMQFDNTIFGRYNDDMRIFSNEKTEIFRAILVLQELLLAKGLNLNASKTEIAENKEEIEKLRSKIYDVYEYMDDTELKIESELESKVDKPFEDFSGTFEEGDQLDNKSAKDFCKSLSARNSSDVLLVSLGNRAPWHIHGLGEILTKWKGSSKHASWLLIQSIFFDEIPDETRNKAKEKLFELLKNPEVCTYGKYRLIHHLVKLRGSNTNYSRYVDSMSTDEKEQLKNISISFLNKPAFELNIVSLYLLRILGDVKENLEKLVNEKALKPIADPIKNALSYFDGTEIKTENLNLISEYEIDDLPVPY
ncbi:MAG: RNA-directed DNA polymerase [Bacteroidetes bacterium]|nr:RNA-directed DNA polymerase [Bacteroidota bacterium]